VRLPRLIDTISWLEFWPFNKVDVDLFVFSIFITRVSFSPPGFLAHAVSLAWLNELTEIHENMPSDPRISAPPLWMVEPCVLSQ
jgi:hypothetical protein